MVPSFGSESVAPSFLGVHRLRAVSLDRAHFLRIVSSSERKGSKWWSPSSKSMKLMISCSLNVYFGGGIRRLCPPSFPDSKAMMDEFVRDDGCNDWPWWALSIGKKKKVMQRQSGIDFLAELIHSWSDEVSGFFSCLGSSDHSSVPLLSSKFDFRIVRPRSTCLGVLGPGGNRCREVFFFFFHSFSFFFLLKAIGKSKIS